MENNIISVMLWGEEVGKLYWNDQLHRAVFNYNPDFIKKGLDIAPLTASITKAFGKNITLLGNKSKIYQGLPEFIADSLPDKWGNTVFEQWAAQNKIPLRTITPVDKLSFIGKRGMGALEFVPDVDIHSDASVQLNSLYLLAKKIFESREQTETLSDESLTMQSLYEVGTSAGGQHLKAIIAINDKTQEIRSGQIDLPEDYTYYLLKFAEGNDFPFTQIEMAYYRMAIEAGINMMPSRLIEVDGKQHFLTKRYDRIGEEKVHTQTLAAMNPDATGYEDLMNVSRKLNIPQSEQTELFRRMVFNVFGANVDDHVKNFSFMMNTDGKWHITPAYDLSFTTNLSGMTYENVHSMTIQGKNDHITVDTLIDFAKINGIKNEKKIICQVATAISNFRKYALMYKVDEHWTDRIEEHLSKLLPAEFSQRMTGYKPTIVEPYMVENKFSIKDVSIIETRLHDFNVHATINDKPYSYVIGRNTTLAKQIIKQGLNKMSEDLKKKYVDKYLLPKAKRDIK